MSIPPRVTSLDSSANSAVSSTGSMSPFLSNSFRQQQQQMSNNNNDIPLQDMGGADNGKNYQYGPTSSDDDRVYKIPFLKRIYNKMIGEDNFVGSSRKVYINEPERNKVFRYISNYVKTAKYTILTFLPLNLFEQFCRLANFYFLIISALQLIPGVSPTGRFTTLGPLCVVLAITALKEAYEDFKRHRQDDRVNNSKSQVFRNGSFEPILWRDIKVGDIIKVVNKQFIPADLLLISSSEPQSMCYIETANLDGETNLKIRQSIDETHYLADDANHLSNFKGMIECEHPNNKLYHFNGSIHMDGKVLPLGVKQVLLRGAQLKNTKWANGVVVYTGDDSKLMRNSSPTPMKRSNVEKSTNFYIIFIFFLQILLCTACAIANGFWSSNNQNAWYLQWTRSPEDEGSLSFLTFLILFNNLIPISLYVSMEFVKLFQAFFINNDIEMYHVETDTPALARTSNLNEELGQIQYIFSDKTGTLTQNKMEFKKCSIGGISYGTGITEATMGKMIREGTQPQLNSSTQPIIHSTDDNINTPPQSSNNNNNGGGNSDPNSKPVGIDFNDDRLVANLNANNQASQVIKDFLYILSVCHTVIPDNDEDGKLVYQASSPDEGALVNAARYFGFEFSKRTTKLVSVNVQGQEMVFEILNVLEFNSTRKRMSVIVRTPEGRLMLYCKGADSVIFERLSSNQPYADITINHLQEFASEGLRTLCIAYCDLDEKLYEEWNKEFHIASTTIIDREAEMDRVAEQIEKNLFLLGATAIEDKLQEGVPETIHILQEAGVKIWVLTGDKQETAINIGFSCQLLNHQMELLIINEETKENTIVEINRRNSEIASRDPDEIKDNLALVIDGHTLMFALEDNICLSLLKLTRQCKSVICCRVSPLQKALIVKLVKDNLRSITLAIGDGANDVSMIQAAHVGIGISGEEGLQAARASDYAIAQFRFLSRLLMVHGRYSYRRITKLICYCFYKNISLYITQFWFTILNGWSGQTFYERFTLTAYNVAWTFIPVIVMGVLDKDISEPMIMNFPQLYQTGIKRYYFNIRVFWGWVLNGLYHSFILYAFPTLIFRYCLPYTSGRAIDLFAMGTVSYSCIVLTVNLKLALETRFWTWINHLSIWGSILIYFMWLVIFGKFWEFESFDVGSDLYSVVYNLGTTSLFYFSILFVPILCLWRDVTWKFIRRTNLPKSYHIVQEIDKKFVLNNLNNSNSKKKIYTGYSFSQESGQADVLKKYNENT
eukprot:gene5005-6233_t